MTLAEHHSEFVERVTHHDNLDKLLDDVNDYTSDQLHGGPMLWPQSTRDFFIDAGVRHVYEILAEHYNKAGE